MRPTSAGQRAGSVLAASILLLAAGCGDGAEDAPPEEPPLPPAPTGPVGQGATQTVEADFSAEVTPGSAAVRIDYAWTNRSEEAVLVVDRPWTRSGAADEPSPTATYAVGLGGDVAQVSQRVFDRPEDAPDYAQEFQVGLTRVEPGATIERRLEVELPIAETKPYDGYYAAGELPLDDPASVQFCLGVLVPPYDARLTDDDPEDGLVGVHGTTELQQLFCSETAPLL